MPEDVQHTEVHRTVSTVDVDDARSGHPGRKPFAVSLRWRDLDHQGHVYHGTILTLLDEARTAWLHDEVGVAQPDSYVVARIELDFRHPLLRSDEGAVAYFEPLGVGRSSVRVNERMHSARTGRLIIESQTTIVMWDQELAVSRPLSLRERTNLASEEHVDGGTR